MIVFSLLLFYPQTEGILWDWCRKDDVTTVYISCPTDSLSFSDKNGLWGIEYRIIIQFTGKGKTLYGSEVYREKEFDKIPSRINDSLRLRIPAGKYKVKITLQDMNTLKKEELLEKIEFDSIYTGIRVADNYGLPIVFRKFKKDDSIFVVLNKAFLYVEIKGKKFFKKMSGRDSVVLPLQSLRNGTYEMLVYEKKDKRKIFIKKISFIVENSFFEDDEEYKEKVNQLLYIATPSEIKRLKNAPKNEREKVWREFWKSKDPTPQTEKNEIEEEYFRRIRYCEENFRRGDKGYLSDRAKVYMKYGEPEDIEYHIFEPQTPDYQVWIYKDGKKFIFVDKHGFGEYILVYPKFP